MTSASLAWPASTGFSCSPRLGDTLITAVGGAGMTTAFGMAKEHFGGEFLRSHQ